MKVGFLLIGVVLHTDGTDSHGVGVDGIEWTGFLCSSHWLAVCLSLQLQELTKTLNNSIGIEM